MLSYIYFTSTLLDFVLISDILEKQFSVFTTLYILHLILPFVMHSILIYTDEYLYPVHIRKDNSKIILLVDLHQFTFY